MLQSENSNCQDYSDIKSDVTKTKIYLKRTLYKFIMRRHTFRIKLKKGNMARDISQANKVSANHYGNW